VHIEQASQTEESTVDIAVLVALDFEFVVAWGDILIYHIDVTDLLAHSFVGTKRFLGWTEPEDGMIDNEVGADFEVESLSLIEAEVVRVHGDWVTPAGLWISNQWIVVVRLLYRVSIVFSHLL